MVAGATLSQSRKQEHVGASFDAAILSSISNRLGSATALLINVNCRSSSLASGPRIHPDGSAGEYRRGNGLAARRSLLAPRVRLKNHLQRQLHVEGLARADARGSVRIADGVGDSPERAG